MTDFLNKLSSYNIFNYLVPGIIFAVAVDAVTQYRLVQSDLVIGLFIYYFIGLVISRFGSLVLEPLLRRISYLQFAAYADFVTASQSDPKIDLLSEVNNTYRTLCSAFILVGLLRLYEVIENWLPVLKEWNITILAILLLITFLISYRKQTGYVARRVAANRGKK